jgi:hypothetical protein
VVLHARLQLPPDRVNPDALRGWRGREAGNSEYLGRRSGLAASVNAGRMNFTNTAPYLEYFVIDSQGVSDAHSSHLSLGNDAPQARRAQNPHVRWSSSLSLAACITITKAGRLKISIKKNLRF